MTTSPHAVIKVSHMSNKNLQDSTTAAAALELSYFKCTQRGWYIIFYHICATFMTCYACIVQVKTIFMSLTHAMNRKV